MFLVIFPTEIKLPKVLLTFIAMYFVLNFTEFLTFSRPVALQWAYIPCLYCVSVLLQYSRPPDHFPLHCFAVFGLISMNIPYQTRFTCVNSIPRINTHGQDFLAPEYNTINFVSPILTSPEVSNLPWHSFPCFSLRFVIIFSPGLGSPCCAPASVPCRASHTNTYLCGVHR